MTTILKLTLVSVLAMALAGASGCLALAAGTAAGVGTYAYVQGEMNTAFEATLDEVWAAALATVDQLQFHTEREAKDALHGRINVRQADGTRIRISMDRQTDALTEVRVRVNIFGDESKSRLILDRIRENLRS
jgi:hypothetical protein